MTKKKKTKKNDPRPIDILTADCVALAQRLETMAFTAHAHERRAQIELDADKVWLVARDPNGPYLVDVRRDACDVMERFSGECGDLAHALRIGMAGIRRSVEDLIALGERTAVGDPTQEP
jgi:hypothetical protein